MFEEQDEYRNWCFQEYLAYCDDASDAALGLIGRHRHFIFLVAEMRRDNLRRPAEAVRPPAEPLDAYKPWYERACALHTEFVECASQVRLREQIEEVGARIDELRNDVLDTLVPEF